MNKFQILFCSLTLAGCGVFQTDDDWLAGIPQRDYFIAAYRASPSNHAYQDQEEYLFWVRRFYTGVTPVPGWLELTERLLARVPIDRHQTVEHRLLELGARIGSEWAKDNRARNINSRMANVWRDALLESLAQDDLENYLDILERDVEALRAGKLDGDEIYFERYYIDDFDF